MMSGVSLPAKLLFLIFFLQLYLSMGAKGQTGQERKPGITLSGYISIDSLIHFIEKECQVKFYYFSADSIYSKKVSVMYVGATLNKVLNDLHSKYGIICRESPPLYVLRNDSNRIGMPIMFSIKGKVIDSNGKGIARATVYMESVVRGTTDDTGHFSFSSSVGKVRLKISCIGYATIDTLLPHDHVTVIMLSTTGTLRTVTVKAPENKKLIKQVPAPMIGGVSRPVIDRYPVGNIADYVQGRIPGIFIRHTSGVDGAPVMIRYRGQQSMNGGSELLFVVNDMPVTHRIPQGLGGDNWGPNMSTLGMFEGTSIESIEVLTDVKAIAKYGSLGVHGAMVISTKSGTKGKPSWIVSTACGISDVPQKISLLGRRQYIGMRLEAFKNDGVIPAEGRAVDLMLWDTTRETNWQKILIGNFAYYQHGQFSVSGGSSNIQFVAGGDYDRNTTVFKSADKRYLTNKGGGYINLKTGSPGGKLHTYLAGNIYLYNTVQPGIDPTSYITLAPVAPSLYLPDGNLNYANGTWENPLLTPSFEAVCRNFLVSIGLSYQLFPKVSIDVHSGYNNMLAHSLVLHPLSLQPPERRQYFTGNAYRYRQEFGSLMGTSTLTYRDSLQKNTLYPGILMLSAGVMANDRNQLGRVMSATGFKDDIYIRDNAHADTVLIEYTGEHYRYNTIYLSAGYDFAKRYELWMHGRQDGSSRLGNDGAYALFWGVGLGWIFSNATFANAVSWLSHGKLRMSIITSGNDQLGDYQFQGNYISTNGTYQGVTGLQSNGLISNHTSWEKTRKINIGIDLRFLEDKLSLKVDHYKNRSTNQLVNYALAELTGANTVFGNLPAVLKNTGWECMLDATILRTRKFTWTAGLNLTIPRNWLESYPNMLSTTFSTPLGKSLSASYVYQSKGADPSNGAYRFSDKQGKAVAADGPAVRNVLVNTDPAFYGGLDNVINYGHLEVSCLLQFTKQTGRLYRTDSRSGVGTARNQPVYVLDRWQKQGDIKTFQRYTQNTSLREEQTMWNRSDQQYGDASYIRCKQLSVIWKFTSPLKGEVAFKTTNLFTITKYKGLDAETQSGELLPPTRVMTVGVKLYLSQPAAGKSLRK